MYCFLSPLEPGGFQIALLLMELSTLPEGPGLSVTHLCFHLHKPCTYYMSVCSWECGGNKMTVLRHGLAIL